MLKEIAEITSLITANYLEEIKKFMYLGSTATTDEEGRKEVRLRTIKTSCFFF